MIALQEGSPKRARSSLSRNGGAIEVSGRLGFRNCVFSFFFWGGGEGGGRRSSASLEVTLRLKMAQKPYMIWSLGPKALKYESLEP